VDALDKLFDSIMLIQPSGQSFANSLFWYGIAGRNLPHIQTKTKMKV